MTIAQLVVRDCSEFELCHNNFLTRDRFEYEIVSDHTATGKPAMVMSAGYSTIGPRPARRPG